MAENMECKKGDYKEDDIESLLEEKKWDLYALFEIFYELAWQRYDLSDKGWCSWEKKIWEFDISESFDTKINEGKYLVNAYGDDNWTFYVNKEVSGNDITITFRRQASAGEWYYADSFSYTIKGDTKMIFFMKKDDWNIVPVIVENHQDYDVYYKTEWRFITPKLAEKWHQEKNIELKESPYIIEKMSEILMDAILWLIKYERNNIIKSSKENRRSL